MKTKPRELRFIAKSAQEAVEHVRRELGPEAKVISVRQVTGSGLQKFLKAPRLEIIAREFEEKSRPELDPERAMDDLSQDASSEASSESGSVRSVTCAKLLANAGFPPSLMARLEGAEDWRRIQAMPVEQGLGKAIAWLHQYRASHSSIETPNRIAFMGTPGSGKTTSLCKYLAREVFIHGHQPEVLRLEVDKPHLDNGLSLYCDVLGVSCKEDPNEIDFDSGQPVLIDIPGFSLEAEDEKSRICEALDNIGVEGRVFVLNAAYDASILQRILGVGSEMQANYQVLTHLDELVDFSKLWSHLFNLSSEVLFFSNGQNVAGDIIDQPFRYLMERTFPK